METDGAQKNVVVSILLPTLNGKKYISQAIDSVRAQTFESWELIIIDDHSDSDTLTHLETWRVKDLRITIIRNDEQRGIQRSLNTGLLHSRGQLIARIDDDDIWETEKLGMQVHFLEMHTDTVLVGTGVKIIDEHGAETARYLLPQEDADIRSRLLRKNCFAHSSVVYRKEVAVACGGYNEGKKALHVEDYDLWLAMGTRGILANLPFYGISYRMHDTAINATHKIAQLTHDILLTKKYKHAYSGYWYSLMFVYLRLIFFVLFRRVPRAFFRGSFIRYYKERW